MLSVSVGKALWPDLLAEDLIHEVSDFDGRPPSCPFGGFTSAATFRPTRSSRSACRIARTSTLCAI